MLQKHNEGLVGPITRASLQLVNFNKSFIGIDGYTPETGITGRDMLRAEILNIVLDKCNHNIILTDSSKFGRIHLNAIGPLTKFHHVITDSGLDEDYRKELTEKLSLTIV